MYPQENEKKVKLYTGSYNAPVVTGDGSVYLWKRDRGSVSGV